MALAILFSAVAALFAVLWVRAALAKRRLEQRFQPVLDLDAEKQRLGSEIERSRGDVSRLQEEIARLQVEHRTLEEEATLRSFGFYKPIYDFSTSEKYEQRLESIRERQKQMLKDKTAATCRIEWQVNGSKAEGRKQINQTLKLMLRAFNGECDAAVAKVSYKNVKAMEARIEKSAEAINASAEVQQCFIAREYVGLKMDELHLAHEYQEKLQAEKEEQKRLREQMREEEAARREMERRLVPQDRIDELGDASVPFEFDVHAVISTHDAPALENALHKRFHVHRVNRVNERKEFFRASLDEIAEVVREHHGEFELTRVAEAADYRKTIAILDEERRVVGESTEQALRAAG